MEGKGRSSVKLGEREKFEVLKFFEHKDTMIEATLMD